MQIKRGLVLEGGAMRGMFTAGVIDVLMENNIKFDGAVGVSAGAVFGCNYKSGQIGRAIRYNKAYCRNWQYCSIRSLITTGDLFGVDFCYNELPFKLDPFDTKSYQKNPMKFYVVATDVMKGLPVYQRCDTGESYDLEWYRASASMPLVSRIVEIGEHKLLDGGIVDPIPLKFFESIGYTKNLVILTQPADYIKTPSKALGLLNIALGKYPALITAMKNRHKIYNAQIKYVNECESKKAALVIRPPKALPIGRIERNPHNLQKTYEIGRATAKKLLSDIKEFLCSKQ